MGNNPAKQVKILMVDDNPSMLSALGFAVENFGMVGVGSPGGQDALAKIAKTRFDLILLDIDMPVMTGLEVCRILKADIKTQDIPVIFVSGRYDMDLVSQAEILGASSLVVKPFSLEKLKDAISKALDPEG